MLAACAFGFAACDEGGSENGGQNGNNTEQGGTEQGGSEQGGTEQGGSEQGGTEQGGSEIVTTVGLSYKINDDGTAYAVAGIGTATDTDIVIPSTYNGLPVTSIGEAAFQNCDGLTEITIPDSVTGIGSYAFQNCDGLTEITIPDSVTSIGDGAFFGCSGLESITVEAGNSVYHSSGNCLIQTGSKTLIAGCKNSVIPTDSSVTGIGNDAFSGCSGLTSITIPDSVTGIGEWAFFECSGLTSITLPDSVTSIGECAFLHCDGLESITVEAENSVYHSSGNCLIETESKTLIAGCKNSEIPTDGSVTYIGSYAFESCSGLTEITIPDSVTGIGDGAFFECSGLDSVTIGNGVKGIGERAFADCDGLTEITIPDSVTSIGGWAFADCRGLTIYCEADSQPSEWDSTWNSDYMGVTRDCPVVWNCNNSNVADDGYIYAVIGGIRYALKSDIATVARQATTLSGAISVPESVTYQGLSYSVTRIGDGAFEDCSGLTSVTIGNGVTSIGNYAFSGCDGLTEIPIPDSVTRIESFAFSGCDGLESVTIGNGVTYIASNVFSNCSGLTSVYYTGTAGEWNAVTIESYGNAALTNATRYYYIENEADVPDDGGNYWHFDTDGVTPVVWGA